MSYFTQVGDNHLNINHVLAQQPTTLEIMQLFQSMPSLTSIKIHTMWDMVNWKQAFEAAPGIRTFVCYTVDDKLLDVVCMTLPQLENIDISRNNNLTDLYPLVRCAKLETLNIAECNNVTNFAFLKSCTELKTLNMSSTNVSNLDFVSSCKLEYLDIDGCRSISNLDVLKTNGLIALDLPFMRLQGKFGRP